MGVTKTLLLSTTVEKLEAVRKAGQVYVDKGTDLADRLAGLILRSADVDGWHGKAQSAAGARADELAGHARVIGAQFQGVGNAQITGADALDKPLENARDLIGNAESASRRHPFQVDEDLTVRDPNRGAFLRDAQSVGWPPERVARMLAERDQAREQIQARLQQAAKDCEEAINACADAMGKGIQLALDQAPVLAALNKAQAEHDAQDVKDGKPLSPQEQARLQAATSLSKEQQDALAEGRDVELSPQQVQYIRALNRALDGKTPQEIKALADKLGVRPQLANAMQLASNAHVVSTLPGVGADGRPGKYEATRGGVGQLPDKVRETLAAQAVVTTRHEAAFPLPSSDEHTYPTLGQLDDLADLVGASDQSARQGSGLDRAMLDKVGETLARSHQDGGSAEIDGKINRTMQHMMDTAGLDSQAFHDAVRDKDHGQQFVGDLLKHNWDDDGEAVKHAVHAATQNAEGTGPAATRSGETMRSLVDYMKDHDKDLTDSAMPGHFNLSDSLGNRNHALAQELAEGFGKYLGAAYGDELPGHATSGFGTMDPDDVTKVFKVLDTDHQAAEKIHAAAYAQSMAWTEKYAGSLISGPDNASFSPMIHAADLLGSVDKASESLGADAQKINSTAFDAAKPWASSLVKLLPGGDVLAKVLDSTSTSLKDAYTGQGPQGHVLDTASLRYQIAENLINNGKLPQNGELNGYLGPDGKLPNPTSITDKLARENYENALALYLAKQSVGLEINTAFDRAEHQYNERKK